MIPSAMAVRIMQQEVAPASSTPRERQQGALDFIRSNTQFRLLKELEIDIDRRIVDANAYQLAPPALDIGGRTVTDCSWRNGSFVRRLAIVGAQCIAYA